MQRSKGVAVAALPWHLLPYAGAEHWTAELRGPAIITAEVVPNRAVDGVYDVSYVVMDAGGRACSLSLSRARALSLSRSLSLLH